MNVKTGSREAIKTRMTTIDVEMVFVASSTSPFWIATE